MILRQDLQHSTPIKKKRYISIRTPNDSFHLTMSPADAHLFRRQATTGAAGDDGDAASTPAAAGTPTTAAAPETTSQAPETSAAPETTSQGELPVFLSRFFFLFSFSFLFLGVLLPLCGFWVSSSLCLRDSAVCICAVLVLASSLLCVPAGCQEKARALSAREVPRLSKSKQKKRGDPERHHQSHDPDLRHHNLDIPSFSTIHSLSQP